MPLTTAAPTAASPLAPTEPSPLALPPPSLAAPPAAVLPPLVVSKFLTPTARRLTRRIKAGEAYAATGVRPGTLALRDFLGAGTYGAVFEAFRACAATGTWQAAGALKVCLMPRTDCTEEAQSVAVLAQLREAMGRNGVGGLHGSAVAAAAAAGAAECGVAPTRVMWCDSDWRMCLLHMPRGDTTLAAALQRPTRAPLHAVRVLAQRLLGAVAALHEAGVAHRDLTPNNVLLQWADDSDSGKTAADGGACCGGRAPRLLLTDFGMASVGVAWTACTNVVTLSHRAPEALLGHPHDPRALDMWAVGVILRDAVTGTSTTKVTAGDQADVALSAILHRRGTPTPAQWPAFYTSAAARATAAQLNQPPLSIDIVAAPQSWRVGMYGSVAAAVPHDADLDCLLDGLLAVNPARRLTAAAALAHPFLAATPTPADAADAALFYDHMRSTARGAAVQLAQAFKAETAKVTDIGTMLLVEPHEENHGNALRYLAHTQLAGAQPADSGALARRWPMGGNAWTGAEAKMRGAALDVIACLCGGEPSWRAPVLLLTADMMSRLLAVATPPCAQLPMLTAVACFLAQAVVTEPSEPQASLGSLLHAMGCPPNTLHVARALVLEAAAALHCVAYPHPLAANSSLHALRVALEPHRCQLGPATLYAVAADAVYLMLRYTAPLPYACAMWRVPLQQGGGSADADDSDTDADDTETETEAAAAGAVVAVAGTNGGMYRRITSITGAAAAAVVDALMWVRADAAGTPMPEAAEARSTKLHGAATSCASSLLDTGRCDGAM